MRLLQYEVRAHVVVMLGNDLICCLGSEFCAVASDRPLVGRYLGQELGREQSLVERARPKSPTACQRVGSFLDRHESPRQGLGQDNRVMD